MLSSQGRAASEGILSTHGHRRKGALLGRPLGDTHGSCDNAVTDAGAARPFVRSLSGRNSGTSSGIGGDFTAVTQSDTGACAVIESGGPAGGGAQGAILRLRPAAIGCGRLPSDSST